MPGVNFSSAKRAAPGATVVVTGAGSGIGAAIAESLVAAGAQVALLDRQAEAARGVAARIDPTGRNTLVLPCDVSDMASVAQAANAVRQRFGPCHSLINNAGLLRAGPLQSVSLDDWNTVLAVNLTGYLLCAREFAPAMCEQGAGSIVNVASIAGQFPQTGSGAYSASKGGVLLLSRQMAVEWGPRGVRSNAVCPGMIRTALSVVLTLWPPGPDERKTSILSSFSGMSMESVPSMSGMTSTAAKLVWRRPWLSNGLIRTSRWVPLSTESVP